VLILSLLGLLVAKAERTMLPIAIEISNHYIKTLINAYIHDAVTEIITELNLTSEDFLLASSENTFSVDTVLVNNVCAKIAARLSEKLSNLESERIGVPIGTATCQKSQVRPQTLSNQGFVHIRVKMF